MVVDNLLHTIVEGTVRNTGPDFYRALVRHFATAMNTRHAFIAEFCGPNRVRSLAFWSNGALLANNVEWDLEGTPCAEVVKGNLCHYPSGVAARFPDDKPLVEMGIESYLGVPLIGSAGEHLGHLAVFDDRPMPEEPRALEVLRIFSARACAELERHRFERSLKESEQRYRDLFDAAPIAYVNEDLESKFLSANRAAQRILGITPEQVPNCVGRSFIPDTPDALRRFEEAFASIGRGTDTSGVVLELRRKDNGEPIFVQWWSNPDPSGTYTRTMFIDITEHVMMEREKARLEQQNVYLQEEIKSVHNFEEIIGSSASLVAVLDEVRQVASTDASVLIQGETGTGKELFARAIHSRSARKDKPLIKLNCAALPPGLVESELFGHEKGAFSGAITKRIGRFELANGGTIFLDEIGELHPDVQAKLLRVLQERELERVGGNTTISVDVRVIAATNRDLPSAIREGKFRADLFYRLNVFPVRLPPLRDREGDIPLLVGFLINRFGPRVGKKIESVSPESMKRLLAYPWPGNVRELENVLERAIILSRSPNLEVSPDLLPAVEPAPPPSAAAAPQPAPPIKSTMPTGGAAAASLEDVERAHIIDVLKQTNGVIEGDRGAAKILSMHPNTLRSRMKKLGIDRLGTGSQTAHRKTVES